jgi:hypothetical protein
MLPDPDSISFGILMIYPGDGVSAAKRAAPDARTARECFHFIASATRKRKNAPLFEAGAIHKRA